MNEVLNNAECGAESGRSCAGRGSGRILFTACVALILGSANPEDASAQKSVPVSPVQVVAQPVSLLGTLSVHPDIVPAPLNGVAALPMRYRPKFPELGKYSINKACRVDIDESWAQVTLHENGPETLKDAFTRLRAKSTRNGILNLRWDAPPAICDSLFGGRNTVFGGTLVIRGIPGPHGEQPRLYCRSDKRDGNLPHKSLAQRGVVFQVAGTTLTLIENLHIDGYKKAVVMPQVGRTVIRNNYLHHQVSNALSSSNVSTPGRKVEYEFCANEVSLGGDSNGEHNFYIHRGITPTTEVHALWVDNFVHSASSSSAVKSIANRNAFYGNRISKQVDTDPSFKPRSSQFLIDIPGCSDNIIEGNWLEGPKLEANSGGQDLIGIRNRKTEVNGCDRPEYGSAQWNDPAYWASLKGEPPFKTVIRNNIFRTRPEGFSGKAHDDKLIAIHDWGTWPNFGPGFGARILKEVPKGYFEQHVTLVEGNTYVGPFRQLYASDVADHCTPGKDVPRHGVCPPYPNPGPVQPANYFRIGKDEVRLP